MTTGAPQRVGAACPSVPGPSGDKSEIRHYPAASFFVFFFQSRHSLIEACWVCLAVSRPGRCRDWYISVGVSSISPTFSESPFTLNILPNASLTSPSPAVLVRRYSSTLEHRLSWSSISELSVCPYLIIVHSTTSQSHRPSLPRAFHGLRRPHHCSSLCLLILDRSHVTVAI